MSASVHAGIHPQSRHPPRSRPPQEQTPPSPREQTHPLGRQTAAYGQRAAGTHPTGMHSCEKIFFRLIPVSLSIMASYVSAILVLGYPAEMYAFGGQWILHAVGTAIGAALACVLFVPLFYPLKLTSINEVSVF